MKLLSKVDDKPYHWIEDLSALPSAEAERKASLNRIWERGGTLNDHLAITIETLDYLKELADATGIEELQKSVENLSSDAEGARRSLYTVEDGIHKEHPTKEDVEASWTGFGQAAVRITKVEQDAQALVKRVMESATAERQKRQWLADLFGVVSITLFILGWILGLLGKLDQNPELTAAHD